VNNDIFPFFSFFIFLSNQDHIFQAVIGSIYTHSANIQVYFSLEISKKHDIFPYKHFFNSGEQHPMSQITIPEDIQNMPFEQALNELETLVAKMENGGLTLEELMNGFERGKLLTISCRSKLATLERKIEILSNDNGADGQWSDFAPGNSRNAPQTPRSPETDEADLPF
jgi:exodeoxyribonuclease VII small subunit